MFPSCTSQSKKEAWPLYVFEKAYATPKNIAEHRHIFGDI